MNLKTVALAGRHLRSLTRKPGGNGVVIALVTFPSIFLAGDVAGLIVLAALLLYPFLDAPRTLWSRSWWLAALIALPVWLIVFALLMVVSETVAPLGEASMAFMLPFMLYPFALTIAGLVRLEGWINGRSRESGPRIAAWVIGATCVLLVVGPLTLATIAMLHEKITGNTRSNYFLSSDATVLSMTTPGDVNVRFPDGRIEAVRFGPDTTFDFRGPGSPLVKGEAGRSWLTAGQRLNVSYVYRRHHAVASAIHIWIDRKGCAKEEKWLAAGHAASSVQDAPPLVGTTWEGTIAVHGGPDSVEVMAFEFMPGQQLAYEDQRRGRSTNGHWRQHGGGVLVEINDCYAMYEGTIAGNEITGEFSNEAGARTPWTAHRMH